MSQVIIQLDKRFLTHPTSAATKHFELFVQVVSWLLAMLPFLPSIRYPPSGDGIWSPVTSTLNWASGFGFWFRVGSG
jgi:hypothetical protein